MKARILNLIVRRTEAGYEIEADPRHAELIVEQVTKEGAGTTTTPGNGMAKEGEDEKELGGEQATQYRALAARCNYLSMDRPDIAVKEACREMAKPTAGAWSRLERIGQYLKGRPRLIWHFDRQSPVSAADVYAGANWAGCHRTRKHQRGGA